MVRHAEICIGLKLVLAAKIWQRYVRLEDFHHRGTTSVVILPWQSFLIPVEGLFLAWRRT